MRLHWLWVGIVMLGFVAACSNDEEQKTVIMHEHEPMDMGPMAADAADSIPADSGPADMGQANTPPPCEMLPGGEDPPAGEDPRTGITWVNIPCGTFSMGRERIQSERPVHQVTVQAFQMSATEVTVGQYRRCVEAGVCSRPCNEWDRCTWNRPGFPWTENHPVNCVDWGQARTYAIWAGGDLATEAQWEYAAKGGEGYLHAGSDSLLDFGWYEGNSGESPKEVGLLNPNGYGLYDMSGNMWEWVLDERHTTYHGAPNQGEAPWGEVPACCPVCDKGSAARVKRGGSYSGNIMQTTVTARSTMPASYRHPENGFRIKRTVAAANGVDSPVQGGEEGCSQGGLVSCGGCPDEVVFVGQVTGEGGDVPNGGRAVFEPWDASYQSGLEQVVSAMPAERVSEGRGLVLDSPIQVTEATVIATAETGESDVSGSRTQFWVGDAGHAMELYLDSTDPDGIPPFDVRVGQKISFSVTRVNRYFGSPQIVGVADMTQVSDHAPVYLWTPDRPFRHTDVHRAVRVTGTLEGEYRECGQGYACWDVASSQFGRVILRAEMQRVRLLRQGSCLTFVGPLGIFENDLQLDVSNRSWLTVY